MTIVPNFLIRKVYIKGSLRKLASDISFDLVNFLGPGIINEIKIIKLNDETFYPDKIFIDTNSKVLHATSISKENPIFVTFLQKATCIIKNVDLLSTDPVKIYVELVSREGGLIRVSVQDELK